MAQPVYLINDRLLIIKQNSSLFISTSLGNKGLTLPKAYRNLGIARKV